MPWLASYQELAKHPKVSRMARRLGISRPTAIGHLHLMWWWVLEYADDGNLARCEAEDIADAAEWDGDAELFVSTLIDAGLLDRSEDGALLVHDWEDYGGKFAERRKLDAERKA